LKSEFFEKYPKLDPAKMPAHIAIIMDGNGRWAKKRLFNRVLGHEQGVNVVVDTVHACHDMGISVLTLYAFSTENWQRPQMEVTALMFLLKKFLKSQLPDMMENHIRLNAIGEIERLPDDVRSLLYDTMKITENHQEMLLNLALSYGGRTEIVQMAQQIARKAQNGEIRPEDITEETVANHLYTKGMPDPDMIIRTSGEMRISNFLLWQMAYSEIFVTPTLWPDFSTDELVNIVIDYQHRERRFGKV
jgi:undecaprenyl diphosphate synthase